MWQYKVIQYFRISLIPLANLELFNMCFALGGKSFTLVFKKHQTYPLYIYPVFSSR